MKTRLAALLLLVMALGALAMAGGCDGANAVSDPSTPRLTVTPHSRQVTPSPQPCNPALTGDCD